MIHTGLPIDSVLPDLVSALKGHDSLLLSAEPGAGKSTVVPIALLQSGLAGKRSVVMLEPRVLAARAAARRMASLLGEKPGETVGYRTRWETVVSPATKIEVVTEAILTKMLQNDPSLDRYGIVIFDEFHERSIHADLALALTLDARSSFRDDLKIVIMSATLERDSLKTLLKDPPEIRAQGRCFPVRVIHSAEHVSLPLEQRVRFAAESALKAFPGDILVFLPGEYEIRTAAALLKTDLSDGSAEILPLYGSLPPTEQDKVFRPHTAGPGDVRRIILATSVAETSVTIPSVGVVIDPGLSRVPRFSPATGMDKLETIRETKAGAEQRKGRAGRTGPGVCIRLWPECEEKAMPSDPQPEILSADLAPAVLELVKWGRTEKDISALPWVTPPPAPMLGQAFDLLRHLGALSDSGALTAQGETMRSLPLHPRIARAVITGARMGLSRTAAEAGALMEGRGELTQTDLRDRLALLRRKAPGTEHLRRTAERLHAGLAGTHRTAPTGPKDPEGILLAAAYPDRIGRTKELHSGIYTLSNGVTASLRNTDPLAGSEFLACGETTSLRGNTVIRLAAPVSLAELEQFLPDLFESAESLSWDDEKAMAVREKTVSLGSLTIRRTRLTGPPPDDQVIPLLLKVIRSAGYRIAFAPSASAESLRLRADFLHRQGIEGFPDFSESGLLDDLENWLAPHLSGVRSFAGLQALDLRSILECRLSGSAPIKLNALAPEKLKVPSGSMIRIRYDDPDRPAVSVRLQELFGMTATPRLAGRVPLLMDILSPAMRTVQKTTDLESFWKESYFLVRKEMRGRYPRHDWPEDPLRAVPHRGVRRPS